MDNQVRNDAPGDSIEPQVKMSQIKAVSYFDLYRIEIGQHKYITKAYHPNRIVLYEREKNLLQRLNHPNIIKPISSTYSLVSRLSNILKSSVILFPEAEKGNLMDYIYSIGPLSERTAKFYFKQILSALTYAHQELNYFHPNIGLDNMLIEHNKNLLLCGWSNFANTPISTVSDLIYKLGEVIINMILGRGLFVSRGCNGDPYGKFLNEKLVGVFWQQIQRVAKSRIKNFNFSSDLKAFLTDLLLKRIHSLDKITESKWLAEDVTLQVIGTELAKQQIQSQQTIKQKRQKQKKYQSEELTIIKEMNSDVEPSLERTNTRSDGIFYDQYTNLENIQIKLDETSRTHNDFQMFSNDPKIIIAHLKSRLKDCETNKQDIIDPLLLLKQYKVSLSNSKLLVDCTFGWNSDIVQSISMCGPALGIEIQLRQNKSSVYGQIKVMDDSELNWYCVSQLRGWFQTILSHYG